jgi:hypothetical protein
MEEDQRGDDPTKTWGPERDHSHDDAHGDQEISERTHTALEELAPDQVQALIERFRERRRGQKEGT